MNGKDKERQKRLNAESAGEQNFPVVTIWLMLLSGVAIAAWMGLPQAEGWVRPVPETIAAKEKLLTLIVASMTLSSLLLTANDPASFRKGFPFIVTGFVAWAAAFTTVPALDLKMAAFMLLTATPLLIAFCGPRMPRISVKAMPLYLLIGGLAMLALFLVLAYSPVGLIMLAFLGFAVTEVFLALLGLSGVIVTIFAITWGAARLRGGG